LGLFRFLRQADPQDNLAEPPGELLGRLRTLEDAFSSMRLDWETVTAHIDQQSNKVHRELGHITRRKRELLELEPDQPDVPAADVPRRGRFARGRGR